jgi:hypothetical protein
MATRQRFDPEDRVHNLQDELGKMYKFSGGNLVSVLVYFDEDQATKKYTGTITSSTGGVATVPDTGHAADYWIDGYIEITSGANIGERYLITDSTNTTITANEFPDSQNGQTYELRLPSHEKQTQYDSGGNIKAVIAWEEV